MVDFYTSSFNSNQFPAYFLTPAPGRRISFINSFMGVVGPDGVRARKS